MKLLQFIKKNVIVFFASVMFVLIITNVILIIYNNSVIERASTVQLKNEKVKHLFTVLWSEVMRSLDVGIRGFVIHRDEKMLLPYKSAQSIYEQTIGALEVLIKDEGDENMKAYNEIRNSFAEHMGYTAFLLELVKADSINAFKNELDKDKGYALYLVYDKNSKIILNNLEALNASSKAASETATTRIIILQILLAIIGLPSIFFMVFRIFQDKREREKLFLELEKNNREFLFNPGTPIEVTDEKQLINDSIVNLQNAANFISQVSKGNFNVNWDKLNAGNKELNSNNLIGELINMREKMKELKEQDEKRIWAADGLAKLSETIRHYQHDIKELCNQVLLFVVKYLKAQQGGMFLVREDAEGKQYLELTACYAFDRKKYINKRVEVGEGLVGQVYLEKQFYLLTQLPQGYTTIASGLGEETPKCLLIVPMIYNETVEAVIELAGFSKFEKYQVEFLEKVGDITASTVGTVLNNEKTKELLDQFKIQTEQLRAQEEELKQNLEELHATQEAIRREELEANGE